MSASGQDLERARLAEHDRAVDRLLADAEAACGPSAWPRVEAAVAALLELYGNGLDRLLLLARSAAANAGAFDAGVADDELLSSLLFVHDLHPLPLERRLERALDRLRDEVPHAAPLRIVGISDGVLRLRAEDAASPPPTTAAIAQAIEREAPELKGVQVEAGTAKTDGGLLPAASLVRGRRP